MPAKPPNPVDVHVGGRVGMRRIEIDMSQQVFGEHIGLTFQQIQKYETGMNRIGASRIQQIARMLEVPASYFSRVRRADGKGAEWDRTAGGFLEFSARETAKPCSCRSLSKIADAKLR